MKRNKKKLKKIIANVMLYTICWRNVDKHDNVWIYDSYNVELGRKKKMEEKIAMVLSVLSIFVGIITIVYNYFNDKDYHQ